jgi:Na+-driven multidrug efflux pump
MNREKDEIREELLVSLLCSLMVLICLYIFVVYSFSEFVLSLFFLMVSQDYSPLIRGQAD